MLKHFYTENNISHCKKDEEDEEGEEDENEISFAVNVVMIKKKLQLC